MTITTTELQGIMETFYRNHQHLPNTIIMPAAGEISGFSPREVESIFCLRVLFAAVPYPRAAIL